MKIRFRRSQETSAHRRGFTIIEMLMVIAVISVLMTLVFSGISGVMSDARARQTEALCQAVQSGLTAYYAQKQKWPGGLGGKVENGNFSGSGEQYELEATEVRAMVKALVDEARDGNSLMDISGLFVSESDGEPGCKGFGVDFLSAVRGTKKTGHRISVGNMYFGYPDKDSGRFRRFKMVYSLPSDSISVSMQ